MQQRPCSTPLLQSRSLFACVLLLLDHHLAVLLQASVHMALAMHASRAGAAATAPSRPPTCPHWAASAAAAGAAAGLLATGTGTGVSERQQLAAQGSCGVCTWEQLLPVRPHWLTVIVIV